MQGPIYTATFTAVAVSAAQDLFEIVAPASKRIAICEIDVGQYSDAGDAQAEMLSLLMLRGYTSAGTGGSALTAANRSSKGRASGATVLANNTTVASGGTPTTVRATSFNVQAGWYYRPRFDVVFDERDIVEPGQRFVVRITAPADAVTMNGTLKYQELQPA